uniref:Uncharacterized protein n=1 Tax=Equus caballus TaxID=9796 RepID=A0A9L0S7W8_HORSE
PWAPTLRVSISTAVKREPEPHNLGLLAGVKALGRLPRLPCSQVRGGAAAGRSPRARCPSPHLHRREGGLEQVEHLAVGQHVPAGHLVLGSFARLPLGLLVEDVALADAPHFLAAADGRQHRHGQHLAQVHGGPVRRARGPRRAAARLAAQAEETEAAGQEARVEVVEHAEPQQAEYGHPQRGQTDAHGGHGAGGRALGEAALTGLPAPAAARSRARRRASYTGARSPAPARPIVLSRERPSRAAKPTVAVPFVQLPRAARSQLSRPAGLTSTLANGREVKGERRLEFPASLKVGQSWN